MQLKLTKDDAEEVSHKLGVLADTDDLRDDYGLTKERVYELIESVPRDGGQWTVPAWAAAAVRDEMQDHVTVLRDIAADARRNREDGQALRIAKQAMKFERMFA